MLEASNTVSLNPCTTVRTIKATAGQLGVSERKVRRDIQDGTLGHVRLGKKRIGVTEQQIADYLASRIVPAVDTEATAKKIMAKFSN